MRPVARTTSAPFSQSPVCGVFWGTEMGRSLPGSGGRWHGFVAAGRCAREGGQDPFCGSASVMYVGGVGSCMIECAAVVSKLFSPLDSTTADHAD